MKNLTLLFLFLVPFISLADPEYSNVLRYLNNLPSYTTDAEAIEGLKNMNVSKEAKTQVHVAVATEMKRYELAWFMTENGYVKLEHIGEMFQRPFADNHTPNRKQMSARTYSDSELLAYAKKFIETGTKVNAGSVQDLRHKNEYPLLTEYLNSLLSNDQTAELNANILRSMLVERPVNFDKVKNHMESTNTPASADALVFARIETVELTKLLLENGADINHDNVLINGINFGNIEVVKYLLEKGANPCKGGNNTYDPLETADRFVKRAKSPERKANIKAIIKYLKPISKKCSE